MVAEKRWDFVLATGQSAKDALSVFPAGSMARRFLELDSLRDLLNDVKGLQLEGERFQQWQHLFTLGENEEVPDDLFEQISSKDSIIGWTLANVLKRTKLIERKQQKLRSMATQHERNIPVCWRIAHVLGAYPTDQNISVLMDFFDNHSSLWVRYGALRSLIELAGRSIAPALRSDVFAALQKRVPQLINNEVMVGELRRALFVRVAPQGWAEAAAGLITALYAAEVEEEERKTWIRLEQQLVRNYGRVGKAV